MLRESGSKNSSIWLIGDSIPTTWEKALESPLDPRHPARHNIWTPVLDRIQEQAFLGDRRRVDGTRLYVRNAVHHPEDRPPYNAMTWDSKLSEETVELGKLLEKHVPSLVFTFGAFAFEFTRRSLEREPRRRIGYWTTISLGGEFRQSVENFSPEAVNVLPLLHVSIARRHFLKSHQNFTGDSEGNYFDFVGREIGGLLLRHRDALDVWVGSQGPTNGQTESV